MTLVRIDATFESLPADETEAKRLIAHALLRNLHPNSYPGDGFLKLEADALPDNTVILAMRMPKLYTVFGTYNDNGELWVETVPGNDASDAAKAAPAGVHVLGAILGDVEIL